MKAYTVLKSMTAALVLALALATSATTADAKSMGGSKGSPVKISHPIKVVKEHDHRYYRSYGSTVVYAAYSSCSWLKVRALETGSRYWWARYEACRDE